MTIVTGQDLTQSIQDALQFISYYHPPDFIKALNEAYEREESVAAKDASIEVFVGKVALR